MAQTVLTDAKVEIEDSPGAGTFTDISDHVNSVTFTFQGNPQEASVMGDGNIKRLNGLTDFSFSIGVNQDYDSGSVDDLLFDLVGADPIEIRVRPFKSKAVSKSNPEYRGDVVVGDYAPIDGNVGEVNQTTVSFQSAQATQPTRKTS